MLNDYYSSSTVVQRYGVVVAIVVVGGGGVDGVMSSPLRSPSPLSTSDCKQFRVAVP